MRQLRVQDNGEASSARSIAFMASAVEAFSWFFLQAGQNALEDTMESKAAILKQNLRGGHNE
jgi:hypothetical protein